MGNRCPDCNKFVSTEIEVESTEAGDLDFEEGIVTLTITLNKNCADCGTNLATATVETEVDIDTEALAKTADWEDQV